MRKVHRMHSTFTLAFAVGMIGLCGCGSADNTADVSAPSSQPSSSAVSMASDASLRSLKPLTKDAVKINYEQFYDEEGNLNLKITDGIDAVKSVHFLLYLEGGEDKNGEADQFLYLGEDNNMSGDYGTGEFHDNFNGYWAMVNDSIVTLEVIEETEKYNLYSIPCIIDGKETSIRALYDYETGTYRILGRYDGLYSEEGSHMTSRGVKKIEDGAQVVFTLASFEGEDLDEYEYQSDAIMWSDDVKLYDGDLGDAIYLYQYIIEDVFGNEIDPEPVEVQVEGDTVTWLTDLE